MPKNKSKKPSTKLTPKEALALQVDSFFKQIGTEDIDDLVFNLVEQFFNSTDGSDELPEELNGDLDELIRAKVASLIFPRK